jgi:hypothetical protein
MSAWHAEITRFEKAGGPLTKRIALAVDGSLKSDGSACVMARGAAWRMPIADIGELASVIERTRSNQALALGALRPGLPDRVEVVTKQKLNGQPDTIARTAADINFRKDKPGLALIDYDTKGMPQQVAERMKERGGFWPSLLVVAPLLGPVARIIRHSTSAGLFRTDTGEKLPGSGGLHGYLAVADGADVERFLRDLHARCWLAGLGWMMVGAGGQLLERSIVDRMVGAPERLIFEGDAILEPPLAQNRESRRPLAQDGAALDTVAACPPLTLVETARLRALRAKEMQRLASDSAKAREAFVAAQAKRLVQRTGLSERAAAEQIGRQCDGALLPDVELPFDDAEFAGCTVRDVLGDPERFEGATLADPLEGVDYGRCKARVMRHADGVPWINSFAHGRTAYELKHNAASVRAAMAKAKPSDVVKVFVTLAVLADLDKEETERLRNEAAKSSGIGKRTIMDMLNEAQFEHRHKRARENRERKLAERNDPRPQIASPLGDAPWLPEMGVINEVIGASTASHPPSRDIEGVTAVTGQVAVPGTHAFESANREED